MPDSTVFAVASAKGGVGKTTTSINLGTALAARGLDVVVVELDLAMANVVDFLSLSFDDEADPSMHDVLAGDVPVTEALYEAPGGATVAPSGTALDALGSLDMNNLSGAIATLAERFDVVVLDTGAGVNSATTTAVSLADETILVSTPRVASVRDTEKTRTIVEQRGGEVGGLVLTQSGTGTSPGSDRLAEFLDVPLLCTVPQDASIHESQDAGVPVVERVPESDAARAYVDGAAALAESRLEPDAPEESEAVEPETTADDATADDEPDADTEPTGSDDEDERTRKPDESETEPPSKETLEADGWTFPGAGNPESADEPDQPEIDVANPDARNRAVRPLTSDGGDASLLDVDPRPDENADPSPAESTSGDGERLPEERNEEPREEAVENEPVVEAERMGAEELEAEAEPTIDEESEAEAEPATGDGAETDDDSADSLAGRVSALLRRSG